MAPIINLNFGTKPPSNQIKDKLRVSIPRQCLSQIIASSQTTTSWTSSNSNRTLLSIALSSNKLVLDLKPQVLKILSSIAIYRANNRLQTMLTFN